MAERHIPKGTHASSPQGVSLDQRNGIADCPWSCPGPQCWLLLCNSGGRWGLWHAVGGHAEPCAGQCPQITGLGAGRVAIEVRLLDEISPEGGGWREGQSL